MGLGHAASPELGTTLAHLLTHHCPSLKHVNLKDISWRKPAALQAFAQGIPAASCLSYLDLSYCLINDEGFHLFVETILQDREGQSSATSSSAAPMGTTRVSSLETLILRGNKLTSASLQDLAALISCDVFASDLARLDLSHMPLLFRQDMQTTDHHQGFQCFLQAIRNSTVLRELSLESCGLNRNYVQGLLQALCPGSSSRLHVLDLNGNLTFRQDQLQVLTDALPHLPHLYRLEVSLMHTDGVEGVRPGEPDESPASKRLRAQEFLDALLHNRQLIHLVVGRRRGRPPPGTAATTAPRPLSHT